MNKCSTIKNNAKREHVALSVSLKVKEEIAPKQSTIDFLKQFARSYHALPTQNEELSLMPLN